MNYLINNTTIDGDDYIEPTFKNLKLAIEFAKYGDDGFNNAIRKFNNYIRNIKINDKSADLNIEKLKEIGLFKNE